MKEMPVVVLNDEFAARKCEGVGCLEFFVEETDSDSDDRDLRQSNKSSIAPFTKLRSKQSYFKPPRRHLLTLLSWRCFDERKV